MPSAQIVESNCGFTLVDRNPHCRAKPLDVVKVGEHPLESRLYWGMVGKLIGYTKGRNGYGVVELPDKTDLLVHPEALELME